MRLFTSTWETCVWVCVNEQFHVEQISDGWKIEHQNALKKYHVGRINDHFIVRASGIDVKKSHGQCQGDAIIICDSMLITVNFFCNHMLESWLFSLPKCPAALEALEFHWTPTDDRNCTVLCLLLLCQRHSVRDRSCLDWCTPPTWEQNVIVIMLCVLVHKQRQQQQQHRKIAIFVRQATIVTFFSMWCVVCASELLQFWGLHISRLNLIDVSVCENITSKNPPKPFFVIWIDWCKYSQHNQISIGHFGARCRYLPVAVHDPCPPGPIVPWFACILLTAEKWNRICFFLYANSRSNPLYPILCEMFDYFCD